MLFLHMIREAAGVCCGSGALCCGIPRSRQVNLSGVHPDSDQTRWSQNSPNELLQSIEQENPHRHALFYRRIADDQPGSVIIREALPRAGQRYNGLLRLARSISSHAQVKDFGRANGATRPSTNALPARPGWVRFIDDAPPVAQGRRQSPVAALAWRPSHAFQRQCGRGSARSPG